MATILTISPSSVIPRRLDGIVTATKSGDVTIEFREKGMVKTKTKSYSAAELIGYEVGEPGFVIERSADPITTVVVSKKFVLNDQAALLGAVISRTIVEDDSREAKVAERASKVKVKLPAAKSSRDEAKPKKKTRKSVEDDEPAPKKRKKVR